VVSTVCPRPGTARPPCGCLFQTARSARVRSGGMPRPSRRQGRTKTAFRLTQNVTQIRPDLRSETFRLAPALARRPDSRSFLSRGVLPWRGPVQRPGRAEPDSRLACALAELRVVEDRVPPYSHSSSGTCPGEQARAHALPGEATRSTRPMWAASRRRHARIHPVEAGRSRSRSLHAVDRAGTPNMHGPHWPGSRRPRRRSSSRPPRAGIAQRRARRSLPYRAAAEPGEVCAGSQRPLKGAQPSAPINY
jgi:hypothetical protein